MATPPYLRKTTAIIGLTGGIACGKSTVGARFRAKGVRVIDADQLAREVTAKGEPALNALVRTFGESILTPEGELDRPALGARVFNDPKALQALNMITHPAILAKTGKAIADAAREGLGWVIYEAALILENKSQGGLSGLICVLCPPDKQLERLMTRNQLSEADARARITAQTTDEVRRQEATWLIENEGSLADLEAKADALYESLVERFGRPGVE